MTPPADGVHSAQAIDGYERLRRHALERSRDETGAPGLVLLMRRGMRAYLEAPAESAVARSTARTTATMSTSDGLTGEIARVMVAMALGAAGREERT